MVPVDATQAKIVRLKALRPFLRDRRLRGHLSIMRRSFLRLYAVDCGRAEVEELKVLNTENIVRLGHHLARQVGFDNRVPALRIVCFGKEANYNDAALGSVRDALTRYPGFWRRSVLLGFARFDSRLPIRRTIVHETVHGLVDLLTDGFPYPFCINEGVARWSEYYYSGAEPPKDGGHGIDGHLAPDEHQTVWELLNYSLQRVGEAPQISITSLALWLHDFLARLRYQRPQLWYMMRELRFRNLRAPAEVYDWLQRNIGLDARDLEESYRLFCTEGLTPDLDVHIAHGVWRQFRGAGDPHGN